MNVTITTIQLEKYKFYLKEEEKSDLTVEKYLRDVSNFNIFLEGRELSKERVVEYKESLKPFYKVSSINSMLGAINNFLRFMGLEDCRVKHIKRQHQIFCEEKKELSKKEYMCLIQTAKQLNKERLSLLMQTICATGIRVSELKYITVNAVKKGRAEVSCKGKARIILIPSKLKRRLLHYMRKKKIKEGSIFLTNSGSPISRSNIWKEMKELSRKAGVPETKVFPHNLRHLFARTYYKIEKDISKLADILGHSNIETTRIYILSTGKEHFKQIEKLGLIV